MEHDPVGADRGRRLHRRPHRDDGLPVELLVGPCEVDQVEGVTDHCLDAGLLAALAKSRDLLVGMHRRLPHLGALREDLDGVAAELLGAVDRRGDASRRRDVRAVQHGATLQRCPRVAPRGS